MRTQFRLQVTGPTFSSGGAARVQASRDLATKKLDPNASLSFPSHWNSEDTRGLFYAMQWRVCGYCSRLLPGNDRGDIDHFRPKKEVAEAPDHGGYWWLGYKISNYVLSCSVCNRYRKSSKFPLRLRASHVRFESRSRLAREARFFLDPTRDDLDGMLTVDLESRLVLVKPKTSVSHIQKIMVERTIRDFGINTDHLLIRDRLVVLDEVIEALDGGDEDRAKMLAVRYSPHSLVAKTLLDSVRPDLLPTKAEEVQWLLNAMLGEIETLLEVLDSSPIVEPSKTYFDESLWGLAALWKAPPDGDIARIKSVLEDSGLLPMVKPLYDQF